MHKKIMIIATEPSGDSLGYDLIKAIQRESDDILFFGIGGEKMESLKFKSIINMKELSVNGIIEVLLRLKSFVKYINQTIKFINTNKPDVIVTIDSPSFNYRLIKKLQHLRNKTKFIHYVAPSVWAWKKYRAKQFSKVYDLLLTLFDFEPKYFEEYKLDSKFVGHPIFFQRRNFKKKNKEKIISFYPGSRVNEINKIFPEMLEVMKIFSNENPSYRLKIVTIPSLVDNIKKIMKNEKFEIISNFNKKEQIMSNSLLAIAASGTISLELAFYKVPMIIVYNANFFTTFIIKKLVKIKWCSLINIMFNREIVPELLFENFNKEEILKKINYFLSDRNNFSKQRKYFGKLSGKLINKNNDPSILAAKLILNIK